MEDLKLWIHDWTRDSELSGDRLASTYPAAPISLLCRKMEELVRLLCEGYLPRTYLALVSVNSFAGCIYSHVCCELTTFTGRCDNFVASRFLTLLLCSVISYTVTVLVFSYSYCLCFSLQLSNWHWESL